VDDETLEPFIRWVAGYSDGVAALAAHDKRRLGKFPRNVYVLGALVLSVCNAKNDQSIGQVARELLERFVDKTSKPSAQPAAPKQ
jgi:hypothetical protein